MTWQQEPCMRCGREAPDVHMRIVDYAAEAKRDGDRIGLVEVIQEIQHRHVVEKVRHVVPQRYGSEWRCKDAVACEERLRVMEVEL